MSRAGRWHTRLEFDELEALLESLHNDKYAYVFPQTNPPPTLVTPVNPPEELSLGGFLLQVLFGITVRTAWLFWRLPVPLWILPYYNYLRYSLNSRLPGPLIAASWLVCFANHDPLTFTTKGRPDGVWFTAADLYQLWYLLAAPVLYRTAFQLPQLLTGIYTRVAEGFGSALSVDICMSDYVVDCYRPTPPAAPSDLVFRRLLAEEHLRRSKTDTDTLNDHRKRRVILLTNDRAHYGWDVYYRELQLRKRRRRGYSEMADVHYFCFREDYRLLSSWTEREEKEVETEEPETTFVITVAGGRKPEIARLAAALAQQHIKGMEVVNDRQSKWAAASTDEMNKTVKPSNHLDKKPLAKSAAGKLLPETAAKSMTKEKEVPPVAKGEGDKHAKPSTGSASAKSMPIPPPPAKDRCEQGDTRPRDTKLRSLMAYDDVSKREAPVARDRVSNTIQHHDTAGSCTQTTRRPSIKPEFVLDSDNDCIMVDVF